MKICLRNCFAVIAVLASVQFAHAAPLKSSPEIVKGINVDDVIAAIKNSKFFTHPPLAALNFVDPTYGQSSNILFEADDQAINKCDTGEGPNYIWDCTQKDGVNREAVVNMIKDGAIKYDGSGFYQISIAATYSTGDPCVFDIKGFLPGSMLLYVNSKATYMHVPFYKVDLSPSISGQPNHFSCSIEVVASYPGF